MSRQMIAGLWAAAGRSPTGANSTSAAGAATAAFASASAVVAWALAGDSVSETSCDASRPATRSQQPARFPLAAKDARFQFHSRAFRPDQSMPAGRIADPSCVQGFRIAAKVVGRSNVRSFAEVGVCVAQNMRAYQEDSWVVLAKDVGVMAKEARARSKRWGWASWFRRAEEQPLSEDSRDEAAGSGNGASERSRPISGTHVSAVVAVFDGHGGDACSQHATRHFHGVFERELQAAKTVDGKQLGVDENFAASPASVLERTLLELDRSFVNSVRFAGGSTAVAVAMDFLHGRLICSNVGDSRAVLVHQQTGAVEGADAAIPVKAVPLSSDHSPSTRPDEVERIVRLGGEVKADMWERALVLAAGGKAESCQRVFHSNGVGGLNMTRSLGDAYLKPLVDPTPETTVTVVQSLVQEEETCHPSFLVLATDGIWDALSNEVVAETVWEVYSSAAPADEQSDSPSKAQLIALALVQMAQNAGSKDNITCMVVQLPTP